MDKLKSMLQSAGKPGGTFVFYGKPGIGKSGVAAHFPKPLFITDPQEDGIWDLISMRSVPKDIQVAQVSSYQDLMDVQTELAAGTDRKTIVFETIGGLERLIHAQCYQEHRYKSDREFLRFHEGPKTSAGLVCNWVNKMQALRNNGLNIILTGHLKPVGITNPQGEDYTIWAPECFKETWAPIAKWVASIFLLQVDVTVEKDEKDIMAKAKVCGTDRVFLTGDDSAAECKNRYDLPQKISMGKSSKEAYDNLVACIKEAKEAAKGR